MHRPRPLLLLALGLALLLGAPPTASADPPSAPASVPEAASEEARAAVRGMVEELRAEAARIRGLEWKREVPADLLTRPQLEANFRAELEKETTPQERERDTRILRRLGLLGPDEDPYELALEMMRELVGGYYDPDAGRLFLIEGLVGDAQRPVLLHELVHALEDQHLDLKARVERWEEDGDRLFAEKCVEEGSAEHARVLYQQAHPEAAAAYARDQMQDESVRRQLAVLRRVPGHMVLPTLLQYQLGPRLVRRAVGDDYPGGMARIYADPPVTQEQVLHPARWFTPRRDLPQGLRWSRDLAALAGEGWSVLDESSVGELDLVLYLEHHLGPGGGRLDTRMMAEGRYASARAWVAGEGWDGGRAVFLEKEGLPLGWVQAFVFDRERDAEEAGGALLAALRRTHGAAFGAGPWTRAGDALRVDARGPHGASRLQVEGDLVVLADGFPPDVLDRLWEEVASPVRERDPEDRWDPALVEDPLADCEIVDRVLGVGVSRPDDSWTARRARERPGQIARLERGPVLVDVLVMNAEGGFPQVRGELEAQFARMAGLPASRLPAEDVTVAGAPGGRYRIPPSPFTGGRPLVVLLGGDDARVLVVRATGPARALAAAEAGLEEIAARAVLRRL